MHKVKRDFKAEEDVDEENDISTAVKTIILTTVHAVIDHSAECSIRDIRDVDYRDGSLVITSEDGDDLLEDLTIDHHRVMDGFSEHDARALAREFRKLKDRERRGSR